MAVSGMLSAAERQMHFRADCRRVDVEDARVHIAHCSKGFVYVLSVDCGREAELNAVAYLDRMFERIARNDRYDRSEDLFLGDPHLRIHIAEYGRLNEVTVLIIAVRKRRAACTQRRFIFILSDLD